MSAAPLSAIGLTVMVLSSLARPAQCQDRLGFDVRPAIAIPGNHLNEWYQTGVGIGAGVDYRVWRQVALYGGWDWYKFPAGEADNDGYSSGPSAGFQVAAPLTHAVSTWVRAGAAYKRLRNITNDRHLGWEAGAGISIALLQRLDLKPALRYRTFTHTYTVTNFPNGSASATDISQTYTDRIAYTTVELAVAFRR